jgi:predicted ATPase
MSDQQAVPKNVLAFVGVHKSITSLKRVELPKFVVLTGVNGSGKTHLLNAIKDGMVSSTIAANPASDVRIFDSTNIVPTDTGLFDPALSQSKRSQWFQQVETHRRQQFASLQSTAIQHGIPGSLCTTIEKIGALTLSDISAAIKDEKRAPQVLATLRQQIKAIGQNIGHGTVRQIGDDAWRKPAQKLLERSPEIFALKPREDFFSDGAFLWGDVDPFQQAFGQVFTTYRSLVQKNDLLGLHPAPPESGRMHLDGDDFTKEFGPPPWEFVNRILEECRLDFRVDYPPMWDTGAYEPKLQKLSKDVEMRFQDLSSGEKVLMSFALCIYNAQESRQEKSFPKLLLLDEIDAPLHPSMAVSLINTIQNVLVRERNVAVILTTHSPSTVALAPEDSLYAMNPEGPQVDKVSKGHALSLLTTGVPTLSISFSGRRQVFVESRTDAMLFDRIYQQFKGHLNSERSLAFVEVGRINGGGIEQAAGCDQVIRLVKELGDGGNESVFGLVDWDGKKVPSLRVHVLSHGIRDGIESVLLDPLLVVATLARGNIDVARRNGVVGRSESYMSLATWSTERWQSAVNRVQAIVIGGEPINGERMLRISYLNGIQLNIRENYLHLDDHALESKVLASFPHLRANSRRAGDLLRHVLDTVLSDHPAFVPSDLLDTLNGLLNCNLMFANQSEEVSTQDVSVASDGTGPVAASEAAAPAPTPSA